MKEIDIKDLEFNPFSMIGSEWMLLTSGQEGDFNTMTVSWANLGVLWGKNVAISYVRPQRYTQKFMEKNDYFTLSVFPNEYKKALAYLGSHSGKDEDKVGAVGITPIHTEEWTTFREAKLIFVCKKLYCSKITPEDFIDKDIIADCYPDKDFHYQYIGEIVKVLVKE